MGLATYRNYGRTVDYTPSSAVSEGDVIVQVDLIGVATADIAADALGALAVEGFVDFPKATGSSSAIPFGTKLYWNTVTSKAQATASTYKLIGKAVEAADDDATVVKIKLDQ